MTWPPYLALQYFWAAGKEYGNYGFILYAGTVVPLQGLWNFFVYARNRQLKKMNERLGVAISQTAGSIRSGMRAVSRNSNVTSRTSTNPKSSAQNDIGAAQESDPTATQNEQVGQAES